jgi:excisionase family DNA binding protein
MSVYSNCRAFKSVNRPAMHPAVVVGWYEVSDMTDLKVVPDTPSTEEEPTGQDQHSYTVNEFAERWRLCPDVVYSLIKSGRLPAIRVTQRGVRILRAGEQQWMETFIDARKPWPEQQTSNGS